MVVDTAHIVAVAAQSRDDLDEARWASEIAVEAAPYDEISRLAQILASPWIERGENHRLVSGRAAKDRP